MKKIDLEFFAHEKEIIKLGLKIPIVQGDFKAFSNAMKKSEEFFLEKI